MPLILVGIDEAGYGPLLGPLCVALAAIRLDQWDAKDTPDLWDVLRPGVCREPGRGGKPDARGRVAIADSKVLKLSNSVSTTHPLVHLERGVLAACQCLTGQAPGDDAALVRALGAVLPSHDCYQGDPLPLPLAHRADSIAIAASVLARSLAGACAGIVSMRCRVLGEDEFNSLVRASGSKAETTGTSLVEHLRSAWSLLEAAPEGTRLGIACDRQGGRTSYAPILDRALPGATITVVEQSEQRSRYILERDGLRAGVAFVVEGEKFHLPVALASMIAKYTRELAMIRFNRHWSKVSGGAGAGREIRPTAGYAQDARRWLDDMREFLGPAEREALVRIA